MPGDGVFSEVTLDGDSLDWMVAKHSAVSVPSTTETNAEILARSMTYGRADSNYVLFARFDPLVEFYPDADDYPSGHCTYFGFGNDESGVVNTFPLTDNARAVYLAEIQRLIASPVAPLSGDADLRNLAARVGTLVPDFDPAVTEYSIELPEGSTGDTLVARAHPNASVSGAGPVPAPDTATVVVTADNGSTKEYVVIITVEEPPVPFVPDITDIEDLSLYPNPALNILKVLSRSNIDYIEVVSLTGESVLNQNIANTNGVAEINISELAAGLYLIRAYANDNLIGFGKFAKQ